MNDRDELQPPLISRMANAVDVSAALDNCFFHSYAAHLLSNKLPLPADLFTPNPVNQGSPAEKLKEIFKGPDDLDVFNAYQQQKYPNAEPSQMLVEKTLVLGVLLRENFAQQLLENNAHKEQLFDNNDENNVSFLKLIDSCRDFGLEHVLADDRMAPICEANRDFFDNLSHTPTPNEAQDIRTYWEQQGYKNYCQHLAEPGVKVSFTDFDPVLKAQNVPYTIYSKQDGSITSENAGDTTQPKFELALAGTEGHYSLLKNNETESILNDYAASLVQYSTDREGLLSMQGTVENNQKACENMPSQLLGAIVPKSIAGDPVQVLIDRCATIKASLVQENLLVQERDQPLLESGANTQELTEQEQRVLEATASSQPDAEKYNAYKNEVKSLIFAARKGNFSNDPDHAIPAGAIESAEALEGESDEDFAKRLQDSEFKGVGLK